MTTVASAASNDGGVTLLAKRNTTKTESMRGIRAISKEMNGGHDQVPAPKRSGE
jgi:hypothetical protein